MTKHLRKILLLKTTIPHSYCCRSESRNVKIINTSKTSETIHSGYSALGMSRVYKLCLPTSIVYNVKAELKTKNKKQINDKG